MSVQGLSNLNSNIPIQAQSKVSFMAQPSTNNVLERVPKNDTIETSNNKQTKNILVTLGAVALAVVGTVFAIKKGKAIRTQKAINEIEQKFLKLENDIPNVQKTFQDVFLNKNLSEKETLEMLRRYRDIEKLSITGSKEEYIEALFKEAHKNYGLKPIKLEIKPLERKTTGGATSSVNEFIHINPETSKDTLIDVIHHELRHAKQHEIVYNQYPDLAPRMIAHYKEILDPTVSKEAEKFLDECIDKNILDSVEIQRLMAEKYKPQFIETLKKYFGELSPNNVPIEQKALAEKLSKDFLERDLMKYREYGEYYRNMSYEADARFAGETMANLFGKPKFTKG